MKHKTALKSPCVFPEFLGNIDPEVFLQNLTNANENENPIDAIRFGAQKMRERGYGFTVIGNFEHVFGEDGAVIAKKFVSMTVTLEENPTTMAEYFKSEGLPLPGEG